MAQLADCDLRRDQFQRGWRRTDCRARGVAQERHSNREGPDGVRDLLQCGWGGSAIANEEVWHVQKLLPWKLFV